MCSYVGIHYRIAYATLNINFYYSKVRYFFVRNANILDKYIASYVLSRHLRTIKMNTYKGLRLVHGRPTKGQRTRANGNSSAKYPYALSFKSVLSNS